MKKFISLISFSAICIISNSASASLLEIRAGYEIQGINSINNEDSNLPEQSGLTGLTADVFIIPTDLVLGVRYEYLTGKKTGSNDYYTEAKFSRTSLVLGYRFWNTGLYLGPLLTVGVSSNLKYRTQGAALNDNKVDKTTFGVGFEAGVHLVGLLVGAEVGFLSANMGNLKDSSGANAKGANGEVMTADLSGTYARAVVGLSF